MCLRPALAFLLLLGLVAGCVQEESVETQDIVSAIPWPDQERAEYVLLDRDGEEEMGRGVLSVRRQDDRFELELRFEGRGDVDESVVLVDAATLKPLSIRRERRNDQTEVVEGEYDAEEGIVEITEISGDGEEQLVPLRLEEHYYENESSLFLWRTIDFEDGYKASYHSVLSNFRQNNLVTLEVVEREEVTVPADEVAGTDVARRSVCFGRAR